MRRNKGSFEKIVREAIRKLPGDIRSRLENVAICVAARPTPLQCRKAGVRSGNVLLGLYEGIPKSRRDTSYGPALPDKITLFQEAIEGIANSPEEIVKLIQETVWHEVAHHFGFDEKQVREMEGP